MRKTILLVVLVLLASIPSRTEAAWPGTLPATCSIAPSWYFLFWGPGAVTFSFANGATVTVNTVLTKISGGGFTAKVSIPRQQPDETFLWEENQTVTQTQNGRCVFQKTKGPPDLRPKRLDEEQIFIY